jgi:hypothetical protein
MLDTNSTVVQFFIIVVVAIVLYTVLSQLKSVVLSSIEKAKDSPYIFKGSKNAKRSLVINQDPRYSSSIPLRRSHAKSDAEFSYTLWLLIENTEYKYGEWKHIFHKGNDSAYPLRAPGLYLHPRDNTLRVYMNTNSEILEYVDIPNVPVRKWMHVGLVLQGRTLNIYINGKLKTKKVFETVPRQNYGNLWVSLFGGFEGFLSKMRYHNYALKYSEMESIVKEGPSKDACSDTGEQPSYLEDSWWYSI